jgi:cytochrome b561
VNPLDALTALALAFVGVRIASGTRIALSGKGRERAMTIVRGLRARHFALALAVLPLVGTAVILLASLPVLSFGWWTALGGLGNPVTGSTERTAGTVFEWLIPVVFLVLLLPALPLFAEAEERMFRLGSERRTRWQRVAKAVQFGLVHALIGIPIGAALGLSVGGLYFTWCYLRAYRRTHDTREALLESTRAHLAYNLVVLIIVIPVLLLAG